MSSSLSGATAMANAALWATRDFEDLPRRFVPAAEPGLTSRASDAGSVKDSASDAGSTATMDTTFSAGTLASAASTAFFPPTVHFFSLDDFAGHEIHAILENGEAEHGDHHQAEDRHDAASSQARSVRPGSIISNLDQRLVDIEGVQGLESWADVDISLLSSLNEAIQRSQVAGSSTSHGADATSGACADFNALMLQDSLCASDDQLLRRTYSSMSGHALLQAAMSEREAQGGTTPGRTESISDTSSPCSSVSGKGKCRSGGGSLSEVAGTSSITKQSASSPHSSQFASCNQSGSNTSNQPSTSQSLPSPPPTASAAYADVLRRGVITGGVLGGMPAGRNVREAIPTAHSMRPRVRPNGRATSMDQSRQYVEQFSRDRARDARAYRARDNAREHLRTQTHLREAVREQSTREEARSHRRSAV